MKIKTKLGEITLNNNDYKGEGGEGQVFVRGPHAYKIYFDPSKALSEGKFTELSVLDKDNILKPLELLYKDAKLIGYSMKYLADTEPLARFFSSSYWQRNNITTTFPIVEQIAKGIDYIHSKDIIIVDGNEFNYLVKDFMPYFIDVDSWQTKSYNAQVIMPSIRDWHNPISKGSDWFSFAIITCQLLLGIHPYKGKYAGTLEERMKNNISIFHDGVSLPNAVRDFGLVPKEYMKWLTNVLEDGKRIAPPDIATQSYVAKTKIITSKLKVEKILSYNGIQSVTYNNGWIVYCKDGVFYGKDKLCDNCEAVAVYQGKPIVCTIVNGKSNLLDCNVKSYFTYGNKLFIMQEDKFFEVLFNTIGGRTIASAGPVTHFLQHSTVKMRGCIYSNILGTNYFFLPTGEGVTVKKGKVVDAKYDKQLKVQYVGDDPLDFVVLDNSLCISFDGSDLTLDNGKDKKVILDCGLLGNLVTDGSGLYCYDKDNIYRVRM